jgi:hypothetical protein
VLPLALRPLTRKEVDELLAGAHRPRLDKLALGLLVAASPDLQPLPPGVPQRLVSDERDVGERLIDLGEAMRAIADGYSPTERELADAPVLDGWRHDVRPSRILVGRVSGHPSIADGRPVVTSEVFAGDGKTWARTLSRFWRLAGPAGTLD